MDVVYKYVTPDRTDILRDCRIRFTQPDALNDPFECLPNMEDFRGPFVELQEAAFRAQYGPEKTNQSSHVLENMVDVVFEQFSTYIGKLFVFLSLSEIQDNILMWSHYAANHSGFVIGFDRASPFFQPGAHSFPGLMNVNYDDYRFKMPKFGLANLEINDLREANKGALFTKSSLWSYERELRLLAASVNAETTLDPTSDTPIYLFDFPKDIVKEVILGYRMSADKKGELVQLVKESFPGVTLWQARPTRNKFALEISPFEEVSNDELQRLGLHDYIKSYMKQDPGPVPYFEQMRSSG